MCNLNHRSVFGGDYLDFTLLDVFPSALSHSLANFLSDMTAKGFRKKNSPSTVDDVHEHIKVQRLKVVVENRGRELQPVAFSASNIVTSQILHLEGIIVHPDHQGRRIGTKLVASEMEVSTSSVLALHTQNEHMKKLAESLAPYDHELALALAVQLGTPNPVVEEVAGNMRVIHPDRYPVGGLYGDMPKGMLVYGFKPKSRNALVVVGRK